MLQQYLSFTTQKDDASHENTPWNLHRVCTGGLPWSDWPIFGMYVFTRIPSNNLGGLFIRLLDIYDILQQYLSVITQKDDARHKNAP